jgi:hypothetical protein
MPLEGTQLRRRQFARLLHAAGFTDQNLIDAFAVGEAESDRYTKAYHVNDDGTTDYGLMQINSVHFGQKVGGREITQESLYDPAFNVQVAHNFFQGAGNVFTPWAAYTSGAYKKSPHIENAITGIANYWREFYGLPPK